MKIQKKNRITKYKNKMKKKSKKREHVNRDENRLYEKVMKIIQP